MTVNPQDEEKQALAGRIALEMTDLSGALERLNDLIARQLGVGSTDLLCLHVLHREGPATAGTLGTRLGRTTGAVTHMIDRLEKAGHVRRRPDLADRRRVVVEADPAGLDQIAAYYVGLEARSRELMSVLTVEQLRTIQDFLVGTRANATAETEQLLG